MSDSSTVAALWVGTGVVWMAVWRASARAGIRGGAAFQSDTTVAAARRLGPPAPTVIADVGVPRSGLAAMIAAAVVLPLLYATSSSGLDPIGTWFGVAAGVGVAGALVSVWEGLGIGSRRQARSRPPGRPTMHERESERDAVGAPKEPPHDDEEG